MPHTQLVMPFAPAVSYEAQDFLEGQANQAALSMVSRWPDWPYSMVLLYGPKGCGKTHLAHIFAARCRGVFLDPQRLGTTPADHLLVGNHCWVLDDIERVRKPEALAQLLNVARARGDYLLLTAGAAASELQIALPDLRSRLMALPTLAMGVPDDALLMGVLAKAFSDRQLRVAPSILEYAVTHLERSYAAAQAFAQAMDVAALAAGRAVTMALVRQVLQLQKTQVM